MDSIEDDLVAALETIKEILDEHPSDMPERIRAVVDAALDGADHHERLRMMGAFNDE